MGVCGVHTQIVPGSLKVTNSNRGRVNLLWILQSVKIYQWRSQVKAGWVGGGREERKKKSNKFRGRLADIMSICHLAPRGRIKGLYEWSLLWEERAAKLLATVDFLQQSINWAGPKQAVYVPLNSECRLACRTFHQRSSSFPWLLFSVLICCIHALAMQKMQRRQMLSFCGGGGHNGPNNTSGWYSPAH